MARRGYADIVIREETKRILEKMKNGDLVNSVSTIGLKSGWDKFLLDLLNTKIDYGRKESKLSKDLQNVGRTVMNVQTAEKNHIDSLRKEDAFIQLEQEVMALREDKKKLEDFIRDYMR